MKPFDKLGHFWGRPRAFDEFFWGKVSAKWLNLVGFKVVKVGGEFSFSWVFFFG